MGGQYAKEVSAYFGEELVHYKLTNNRYVKRMYILFEMDDV